MLLLRMLSLIPAPFGRARQSIVVLRLCLLLCIFALLEARGRGRPALSKAQRLSCNRVLKELEDAMSSGMALPIWQRSAALRTGTANVTTGESDVEQIRLGPCRNNLYEWHFTFAGPPDTVFEGGIYHGRVLLPADYPASAPHVQMMTPNGRFEVNTDICLSASAFHQETWQPAWTVRTLVSALRAHMSTKACEIGGIELPTIRRLRYAEKSRKWRCRACECDHAEFPGQIFRSMPHVDVKKWCPGVEEEKLQQLQGPLGKRRRKRTGGAMKPKPKSFVTTLSGVVLSPSFIGIVFLVFFLFLNLA